MCTSGTAEFTIERLEPSENCQPTPEPSESQVPERNNGNKMILPLSSVDMEDVQLTLDRMREKESTIYKRDEVSDELIALWRRMLIEWMFYVVDYCKLQRQSVAAAAFFLDVAMAKGLCISREEHQLAAATALQLALKTFDIAVIKLEKLVNLGRGQFTEDDVAKMEMKIIREMSWMLHPPSTYCFLRQYERLIPAAVSESAREMIDEVTKLVAELTVLEDQYIRFDPSVLGFATMLLGLEMIPENVIPVYLRQCFLVRMSAVANLDSSSPVVLEAFDCLRESLDNSNKLHDVLDTIVSKTGAFDSAEDALDKYSKHSRGDSVLAGLHHSPRDVKVRIGRGGSFLSASSSSLSPADFET
mmetsp:Transcript_13109/g.21111  ORF Transcript_13109/g.21111 Transcript_13109/m.21111 type:complete len:359 (-) Transcript_13109:85-1161(-)